MLKAFERLTNRLQSIESVRRLKLKTGITILMFFTVITYQAHLIIIGQRLDQSCGRLSEPDRDNYQNSQRGDRYSFIENRLSSEQYQLTVIILLISLDSSANLLSFKTKSIIIASIVCLQILPFAARLAAGCNLTGVNNDQLGNENARSSIVDNDSSKRNNQQVPNWTSNALLFVMALWSLAFARQLEYTSRSNFLWRMRLNVDHEELEYISGINKVLLENILPSHVVQHYLTNPNGQQTSKNQLPNLQPYMRMSEYQQARFGCIALLNEIICDFDKLLLKNKFSRIEKIKTIGSGWIGRRASNAAGQIVGSVSLGTDLSADDKRLVIGRQKLNLICMVQFATNLMTALNGINKQSFQVFKLRVGVNAGPVIAGVIGAQRPFYDIWGDCVNIASRMESMGQVGRIQVEEKTAKLLQESLCSETYSIVRRGTINVKGKGGMVTYFVDKKAATSAAGNAIGGSGLVDRLERKNSAADRQATMQPNECQTSTT
ncbi:hypothetical protein SUGI_1516680 [Cryptomeria japonica]|uniref:adenylate cyclase n=1 Tax=Cryptomeria japonica TaxID=3369 RepID=A0AAD3RSA5_CRYJA|nr:hypothetical protein SUGI_1516680 [Cryptomeria japonica]